MQLILTFIEPLAVETIEQPQGINMKHTYTTLNLPTLIPGIWRVVLSIYLLLSGNYLVLSKLKIFDICLTKAYWLLKK